jgi:hypothetical protein
MKNIYRILALVCIITGLLSIYAFYIKYGEVPAHLIWESPEVKPSIMSVGYKIYGNPKIDNGHFYLSKIQFKNTGEHSVTDFQISYKVDDYTPDWSEPEVHKEIPAGYSFNALYYPRFQDKIAKLRNSVTTTFRARAKWKEEGKEFEEVFSKDISIQAINTLVCSDIPEKERVIFQDNFNTAAFSMSMVTPNDPVVTAYSSQITKLAGGTTAGISGGRTEVIRICKYIYEYMILTKLRYVGDSATLNTFGDVKTLTQNVRLPRDVIIDNQGLCLELSLLWASILEHIGVRCTVVFIPGHAFVVAYAPNDGVPFDYGLAIETTAITPQAVGEKEIVSFEKATEISSKIYNKYSATGEMMRFDVQTYQNYGFTPPELSDYDITKLVDMLSQRLPHQSDQSELRHQNIESNNSKNDSGYNTNESNNKQDEAPYNPNNQSSVNPNEQQNNTVSPNQTSNNDDELIAYISPDNKFSISHYKEWDVESLSDIGLKLSHGPIFIMISPMRGASSGAQILTLIANQFANNYRNFTRIEQAQFNIPNNRLAYNSKFRGINKLNQQIHLSIIGVDGVGSDGYAIIISTPEKDYISSRDDVNEMLKTLIFR